MLDACGPVRQRCYDGAPVREELLVVDGACVARAESLGRCKADQACVEEPKSCDAEGCVTARCVEDQCDPSTDCASIRAFCDGDVAVAPSGGAVCNPVTGRCSDPGAFVEDCGPSGRVCFDGECLTRGAICTPPCADETVCRQNQCVDPEVCVPDCGAGQTCVEGRCVNAPPPQCEPPCADDERCQDGVCVLLPRGCAPPCAQGQACDDGVCVDVCDPACPAEQRCDGGVCVDACEPACPENQRCDGGVCFDACDPVCADGERCEAGLCVAVCDPACGDDERCDRARCVPARVFVADRYAAHRFAMVGQAVDLSALGAALSVPAEALRVEGDTATCVASGTACVRFDYGLVPGRHIQTACVVCLADEGSCEGLPPAVLDLEPGDGVAREQANYLASGAGRYYRVCEGPSGLRVEIGAPLPPLMLRVAPAFGVDAGGAPRGVEDLTLGRNTTLLTLSGERLAPAWLTVMTHDVDGFDIDVDGVVRVDDPVCDTDAFSSLGCSYALDAVGNGDVFTIATGAVSGAEIDGLIRQRPERVAALARRHGSALWDADLTGLDEMAVRREMVRRWLGVELFRAYADAFDRRFDLRSRGIRIAYLGHPDHRRTIDAICIDDPLCADLEAELRAADASALAAMRGDGYAEIWLQTSVRYDADGPWPLASTAPHFSLFDGVVLDVDTLVNPPASELVIGPNLEAALGAAAIETGDLPVIISPSVGPLAPYVEGLECPQICVPDLPGYYAVVETVWTSSQAAFGPERLRAFAVPLFDGDHFDIERPLEGNLHRVVETGYNNPTLNPYLTR